MCSLISINQSIISQYLYNPFKNPKVNKVLYKKTIK